MEEAKKQEKIWTIVLAVGSCLTMLSVLIPCAKVSSGDVTGKWNVIQFLAKVKLLDEMESGVPLSTVWVFLMVSVLFYAAAIALGIRVLVAIVRAENRVVKSRMALLQAGLNLIGGAVCLVAATSLLKENCMMGSALIPLVLSILLAVIRVLYGKAAYQSYLMSMTGNMTEEEKKNASRCTICGAAYIGKLCPNCTDKAFTAPKIVCVDCGYANLSTARTCTKCGIPLKGMKE